MIDLSGRVAVVTGAGAGLGRAHAVLLAQRGASVVVNDLSDNARAVVDEISRVGGKAIACTGSVADEGDAARVISTAVDTWGRIDILVNNAGILRDKTFAKMSMDDFRLVMDVHVMGAVYCTKAAWEPMSRQNFGRIVMTTSASGLWGNFGQANYSAAKMALVGLMQTLSLEGARKNIRVNCLAPTASTQMLEAIMPPNTRDALSPERVSPGLLALVDDNAPTRAILCAGAGSFEAAHIIYTRGVHLGRDEETPERVRDKWDAICDLSSFSVPIDGFAQSRHELAKDGIALSEGEMA